LKSLVPSIVLVALCWSAPAALAQSAPDWPEHYDPFTLLSYHLTLSESDWNTIRSDQSYDIEVPALLAAEGEAPVLVSVRRKSASAFPSESNPEKVSLKIDLNEFTGEDAAGNPICDGDYGFEAPCVETWHGLKKLSLENGDDMNVVTEGFAWYLNRLASEDPAIDFTPGLAAWIQLFITLTRADGSVADSFYNGVFVNVEQRDKQFLKNHGLWAGGDDTWLYKYSDRWVPELKEAPEDAQGEPVHSPFFLDALYHEPFQPCDLPWLLPAGPCDPLPEGEAFVTLLDTTLNVQGLIAFGAVSGFLVSGDDLFSKNKNYYHVDYSDTAIGRREYLQWDLDSAMRALKTDRSIYRQANKRNGEVEAAILGNPVVRERYTDMMRALLDGPLAEQGLLDDLDAFQALLGAALDADPHSPAGSGFFDDMRSWVRDRTAFVRAELGDAPPPGGDPPGGEDVALHVADLSGASATGRGNRWEAIASVAIHDGDEAPVDGVTVSVAWSTGKQGSCQTQAGACSVSLMLRQNVGSVSFHVADLEASGSFYDAAADHESGPVTITQP
jgi:hypothetical protein